MGRCLQRRVFWHRHTIPTTAVEISTTENPPHKGCEIHSRTRQVCTRGANPRGRMEPDGSIESLQPEIRAVRPKFRTRYNTHSRITRVPSSQAVVGTIRLRLRGSAHMPSVHCYVRAVGVVGERLSRVMRRLGRQPAAWRPCAWHTHPPPTANTKSSRAVRHSNIIIKRPRQKAERR